ncbi:MAG TPA: class I SAM-dependent methyltransferase [Candidatus Paceibacterota bacterium]|nr:class I SAM-dependent methyltransferase [Candidatus Paceibacterota bacterium]
MYQAEQEQYASLGRNYWWLGSKYDVIIDLVRRNLHRIGSSELSLLDVGCGPGNIVDLLLPFGRTYGIDPSPDAVRIAAGRGFTELRVADVEHIPYPDAMFDIVTAIDIVEHVEDDLGALREIRRVLKPGGILFFSVPAYQFLWGDNDDLFGHKRRYTRSEIRTKLKQSGFMCQQVSYLQPLFVLPLFLLRKIKKALGKRTHDFVRPPHVVNSMLYQLLAAEKYVLRLGDIPFGATIVGVATQSV